MQTKEHLGQSSRYFNLFKEFLALYGIDIDDAHKLQKIALADDSGVSKIDVEGLLVGKNDIWMKYETATLRKKKIIICDPYFHSVCKTSDELLFFRLLIGFGVELHFWNSNLNVDEPGFSSMSDFWQQLQKLEPASKSKVTKNLNDRGISTNNTIILDASSYPKFINEFKSILDKWSCATRSDFYISHPACDKLTNYVYNLLRPNERDAIDVENIKVMKGANITDIAELNHIAEKYSNLERLEIIGLSENFDWCKFPKLKDLTLSGYMSPSLDLTMASVSKLTIYSRYSNPLFKLPKTLTELKINGQLPDNFDLSVCIYLKKLEIRTPCDLVGLKLPPSLTELTIDGRTLDGFDFSCYGNLKKLEIRTPCDLVGLKLPPSLTELTIDGGRTLDGFDFSCCKNLRKLMITTWFYIVGLKLPPSLTELTIDGGRTLDGFDFSCYGNLKKLEIRTPCDLVGLKLPPSLTELTIDGGRTLDGFDFSCYGNLKKLEIRTGSNIVGLKLPPSLTELTIKGCMQGDFDFSCYGNLEKLTISAGDNIVGLKLPPSLTELTIDGGTLDGFDFSCCKNLRKLEIRTGSNIVGLKLPPSLTELTIKGCMQGDFDFSCYGNLEKLTISTESNIVGLKLPTSLIELLVKGCVQNILDIRQCVHLTKLKFMTSGELWLDELKLPDSISFLSINCRLLKSLDALLSNLHNTLEILRLYLESPMPLPISLTNFPHLKIIRIRGAEQIVNIKNCPNLRVKEGAICEVSSSLMLKNSSEQHYTPRNNPLSSVNSSSGSRSFLMDANAEASRTRTTIVDNIDRCYECCGYLSSMGKIFPPRDYRVYINDIVNENGQILSAPIDTTNLSKEENTITPIAALTDDFVNNSNRAPELVLGNFDLTLSCDRLTLLPNPEAGSKLLSIFSSDPKNILLFFDKNAGQYYCKLASGTGRKVHVVYTMLRNSGYRLEKCSNLAFNQEENLLPEKAQAWITTICHEIPALKFLESTILSLSEKIEKLVDYFSTFEDKRIPGETRNDLIINSLKLKRGVCRHRAYLFTLIARSLGVKTRTVSNDRHAFPECLCKAGGEADYAYKGVELGGGRPPPVLNSIVQFTLFDTYDLGKCSNILSTAATYSNVVFDPKTKKITFQQSTPAFSINSNTVILDGYKIPIIATAWTVACRSSYTLGFFDISRIRNIWRDMQADLVGLDPGCATRLSDFDLFNQCLSRKRFFGIEDLLNHKVILMAMLHGIGIPARIKIGSDIQLEIPRIKDGQIHWEAINTFPEALTSRLLSSSSGKGTSNTLVSQLKKLLKHAFADEALLVKDTNQLLKIHNPFVLLSASQSPEAVCRIIIENLEDGKDYIYIDSPKEFELFFDGYELKNGEYKKNPGFLQELITKPSAVIIINWNNFADEMVAFNALLDNVGNQTPSLFNHDINKGVKIIGLYSDDVKKSPLNVAMQSRVTEVTLDNNFFVSSSTAVKLRKNAKDKVSSSTIEFDLGGGYAWKERLCGRLQLNGDTVTFIEAAIISVLKTKSNLVLKNCPVGDAEFENFLFRINVEKKIYLFDSETRYKRRIDIPSDFMLTCDYQKSKKDDCDHDIECLPDTKASWNNFSGRTFYLNYCNFHLYEELLTLDVKNKTATQIRGLLDKYEYNRGDVIYVTQLLPDEVWYFLQHALHTTYKDKKFKFIFAKNAERNDAGITKLEMPTSISSSSSTSLTTYPSSSLSETCAIKYNIYFSDDPYFIAKKFQKSAMEASLIIPIGTKTTYADIVAKITIAKTGADKHEFDFNPSALFEALKVGKHVILYGNIALSLYHQLLPLLSATSPYVWFNGEWTKVDGKLSLVVSSQMRKMLDFMEMEERNPSWHNYFCSLTKDQTFKFTQDDWGDFFKLNKFWELASKLTHSGTTMPPDPLMNFARIKRCLIALHSRKFHKQNPIKGIFHFEYDPESAIYAYLNVIAKIIFKTDEPDQKPSMRQDKLDALIMGQKIDITNLLQVKLHFWHIANCFSPAYLASIFGAEWKQELNFSTNPPIIKDDSKIVDKLFNSLNNLKSIEKRPVSSFKQRHQKLINMVHDLLQDVRYPAIFLKGSSGAGKSHLAENLSTETKLNVVSFCGLEKFKEWANSSTDELKVLILEEGNLAADGVWDFLQGINDYGKQDEGKQIAYQNKIYKLTDKHKIIITGNPEYFPDRRYHSFFRNCAEIVTVKPLTCDFLIQDILKPILRKTGLENFAEALLRVYQAVSKYTSHVVSIRDLKSLAYRFVSRCGDLDNGTTQANFVKACVDEFAYGIRDCAKRAEFIKNLPSLLGSWASATTASSRPDVIVIGDVIIPSGHQELLSIIKQDLAMRAKRLAGDEMALACTKEGLLLEGPPGVGKTVLLEEILKSQNISYNKINAGNKGKTRELIIMAFKTNTPIILDELNIDPKNEVLLNNLLDGLDENGQPANKPGFMVFATQNVGLSGCKTTSRALYNRLHQLCCPDYSEAELIEIAAYKLDPKHFKTLAGSDSGNAGQHGVRLSKEDVAAAISKELKGKEKENIHEDNNVSNVGDTLDDLKKESPRKLAEAFVAVWSEHIKTHPKETSRKFFILLDELRKLLDLKAEAYIASIANRNSR